MSINTYSSLSKEDIRIAYEEFRAILVGGQSNREFFHSAHAVCEFFEKLLRDHQMEENDG